MLNKYVLNFCQFFLHIGIFSLKVFKLKSPYYFFLIWPYIRGDFSNPFPIFQFLEKIFFTVTI